MKRKLNKICLLKAIRLSFISLPVVLGSLPAAYAGMVVSDEGVSSSGPGSVDEIRRITFENNVDGVYVVQASDSAVLTAEDLVLSSTGNGGGGVLIKSGANIKGQDLTISVGDGGHAGISVESSGLATLNNVAIDVQGAANGLVLDGGSDTSLVSVVMSDSTISAADGSAVLVRYGDLVLNNATLSSTSAAAISVSPTNATFTLSDSTLTGGNGELLDVYTNGGTEYSTVTLAASNSQLNGAINVDDTGHTVSVSLLSGTSLNGGVTNATSLTLDGTSIWNMDSSSLVGQLSNNGTIVFSYASAFDTLTVNGNYQGNGGLLVMNTVLGDDSSVTNKLVVTGDVAEGTTRVSINNLGGQGEQTVEGIEVVSVGGTSYGSFVKSGRIVAGAYDYDLTKNGESWYLTSQAGSSHTVNGRPEAGSYTANIAAANTMFAMRLHDRLGETQFVDVLSGENKVTSLWLRQVGGHNRWRNETGELNTQSNRYVVQLGGDIAQWGAGDQQRAHLGVMGGYANSQSHTLSSRFGSRSKVEGYSAGVYATWHANNADKSGAYIDNWLLYNWFDNVVNGDLLATESYKSKGFSASLETGYTLKLAEIGTGVARGWFIQPQAQLTWMGVEANNHTEENGTRVSGSGDGNLQTRLGLRTWLQGHSSIDNGKSRLFQPFVEANWVHNSRRFGVQMDDVVVNQSGGKNLAELKTGVEGQISPRLNLWGNVGAQVGDNGYSDTSAQLGVKYNF